MVGTNPNETVMTSLETTNYHKASQNVYGKKKYDVIQKNFSSVRYDILGHPVKMNKTMGHFFVKKSGVDFTHPT